MIDSLTLPMMRQDLLWRKLKDLDADVCYGSLAALQNFTIPRAAFGGEADVRAVMRAPEIRPPDLVLGAT